MWQEDINLTILFISGVSSLVLALYVYIKNPKQKLNRGFLYLGLAVFFWCLADFLTIITKNIFWARAAHAFGSLIPLAGYFFCCELAGKEIKKITKIFFFVVSIFFFYVCFTPLVIEKITNYYAFGYDAVFGPYFVLWAAYMAIVAPYCFSIPIRALSKVKKNLKLQIPYFVLGFGSFSLWALASCVILPFFGNARLDMTGSPSTIFIITVVSYGIIKNQLLGIRSRFFQAFISSLVIVIITMVLAALMLFEVWFFTSNQPIGAFVVATLAAITLFFIGQSFFGKTSALERARIELTDLLKKSEQDRLKAEEERNKTLTIIGNFADGLLILDSQEKTFIINPEAEKILQINPAQALGKPFEELKNFSIAGRVVSALGPGIGQVFKKEVDINENLILEVSVIPLAFGKDNLGKLIVLHDITREKIVENMKTEFVSLAAHQLRTPLSAIKWSLKMFLGGDFGKINKEQKDVVKKTYTRNEYLISLVDDLLNVTKIEEGRYLYSQSSADIESIVEAVIKSYKDEVRARKIKIEFKKPAEKLPQVFVDADKMGLAIQNLVDNAVRYTEAGGKVTVSLESDGKEIKFKVSDTGMGVAERDKKNLFSKFFRGDNAVKIKTEGSGLGLFLTKNIIEAHHGKIWFDSEENRGTNFYFTIPLAFKN